MSAARFEYVTANDVFAGLKGGGTLSVEEWPGGDLVAEARRIENGPDGTEGLLLVEIREDCVGGAPIYTVSMHPDESDRLALIERAIDALESAREALTECGYVDGAGRKGDQ